MTPEEQDRLDGDGYLVLENFIDERLLNSLREHIGQLFLMEGERAGAEFKQEEQTLRLANLVDKGEIFEQGIAVPEILERIVIILGRGFMRAVLMVRWPILH